MDKHTGPTKTNARDEGRSALAAVGLGAGKLTYHIPDEVPLWIQQERLRPAATRAYKKAVKAGGPYGGCCPQALKARFVYLIATLPERDKYERVVGATVVVVLW